MLSASPRNSTAASSRNLIHCVSRTRTGGGIRSPLRRVCRRPSRSRARVRGRSKVVTQRFPPESWVFDSGLLLGNQALHELGSFLQ
jgi:hypothetical protein